MGFADLYKKNAEPHVDTPAQAKARADATADVKAKRDAKAARAAAVRVPREKDGAPPQKTTPTE